MLKEDWSTLADKEATPEKIGESVCRIVTAISENLLAEKSCRISAKASECNNELSPEFTRIRYPVRKRRLTSNVESDCKLSRKDTVLIEDQGDMNAKLNGQSQ